ncbi:MAG TPA: hypothetical protein VFQ35_28310 [Polyangiaceae bacterium]|nr:hypothetical protein [Polyangiaceae bacterium]
MNTEDRLRDLPTYDVDAPVAARIRARAHAALPSESTARTIVALGARNDWFYRIVEPAALIGLGIAQLFWTVHDTFALFR